MSSPFPITTSQAQVSMLNIVTEVMSLQPSALLTMFEIDVGSLGFNIGVISQTEVTLQQATTFRFHNNINLSTSSLFWQGNEYIAAPIIMTNMETNLKGPLALPKMSITVSDDGIPLLTLLKQRIYQLGDIVGAKLTRIRTFARFIDQINFPITQTPPPNFYPDPNAELPRDYFYIDRLSNENKNFIEYELSPFFVIEGINLPGRVISEDSCPWFYRGEGCLYEYASRETSIHNGGTLPASAPPIANVYNQTFQSLFTSPLTDRGSYNPGQIYQYADVVYILNRGIKYYFVSNTANNTTSPPSAQWAADECSKQLLGCKLRWQNVASGILPYGAFLSVNRFA
jgi:lambda family phage minor tail protein L